MYNLFEYELPLCITCIDFNLSELLINVYRRDKHVVSK